MTTDVLASTRTPPSCSLPVPSLPACNLAPTCALPACNLSTNNSPALPAETEQTEPPSATMGLDKDFGREIEANAMYFLGAATFALGSIFFLPQMHKSATLEAHGITEGVLLKFGTHAFVFGSLLFTLAALINAINISVHGTLFTQTITTKLSLLSLFFSLAGGVLYSVGSVLFYPQLVGSCAPALADSASASVSEWSLIDVGTHYFVAGAASYVAASTINVVVALLKHLPALGADLHLEMHPVRPERTSMRSSNFKRDQARISSAILQHEIQPSTNRGKESEAGEGWRSGLDAATDKLDTPAGSADRQASRASKHTLAGWATLVE